MAILAAICGIMFITGLARYVALSFLDYGLDKSLLFVIIPLFVAMICLLVRLVKLL